MDAARGSNAADRARRAVSGSVTDRAAAAAERRRELNASGSSGHRGGQQLLELRAGGVGERVGVRDSEVTVARVRGVPSRRKGLKPPAPTAGAAFGLAVGGAGMSIGR